MKSSATVVVTQLTLDAIKDSIDALKYLANSPEMILSAERDDDVGEIIRGRITNITYHRAILKRFLQDCTEKMNE